jgi:hypothetical protein
MALKLPIGIQDFEKLRDGNFVYVDKTEIIHEITTNHAATFFLSRPRRFGKSLLVSTLRYLFEGRRELFKNLWIENHWNWDVKHPVIRLSFDAIGHKELGLKAALIHALTQVATQFDIELKQKEPSTSFQELIQTIAAKYGKVVILIDEYDRPIIDFLGLKTMPQAEANRGILKSFFSILKSEDSNIRFLFLTGISKFSKVSIFSDLNHLYDLSNDPECSTLCGYTQGEIDHYFAENLSKMPPDTREKMREWYNGYSWNGHDFLYNPFSVLSFFKAKNYQNFWFSTGTPTFLVERLNRDFLFALDDIEVDAQVLEAYELDTLEPIPLLFQTGYLTIKVQTEFDTVLLSYPNREVRQSLVRFLLADYTRQTSVLPRIGQIVEAINGNDLSKVMELFNGLFKAIPNQIFIANREAYFQSVIYLTFILLGVYSQAEVSSSDGRLDALIHTPDRLFIFEFKLHDSAESALQQIKTKDYAAAFRHMNKTIIGVGVKFSETEKGIGNWISEEI